MKIVSSAVYQLSSDDKAVKVNASTAAVVLRLPKSGGNITVTKSDSSANAVTIVPYLGDDMREGVRQVETATAAGTITVAGNATVTVTGAYITDSPLAVSVAVLEGDTANAIAAAIRNTLNNTAKVAEHYTVTGAAASIVLTAKDYKATDSSLNVAIADGTCTGVTTAESSTGTLAGVAVQLLKQNEYKTLSKTDLGWTVVDSGGANKTETLANKTLTAPEVNGGTMNTVELVNAYQTVTINPHDYNAGATDWTLSAAERILPIHKPTNANGPVNAIVDITKRPYIFINGTGQNLVVKTADGTGITIANNKAAMVMSDGVNVIRLTPDA